MKSKSNTGILAVLITCLLIIQPFMTQNVKGQCEGEVSAILTDNSLCNAYSCDLLCFESPTGNDDVSAQMEIEVSENGDEITIRTTYAKTFCDNTYGDNTIGWPGNNHTFNHLKGSDKLELELYNGDGEIALKFKIDYIHDNDLGPSGYATGGVSDPDGDGKVLIGDEEDILNVRTSLSENFNTYGYVLTTNSPETDADYTPNPDYPNWIYEVWYEVTVSADAFGDSGYDHPVISDFHASPSKTGNNSEPLEFVGCCEDSCDGSINLTISGDNGPYTFIWNTGESTEDLEGLCEGDYEVTITDALGCESIYTYQIENTVPDIEVDALITNNSICGDNICEALCFESSTGNDDVSAQMEIEVSENGDEITIRTTYAKTFCDNTYGDNTIDWPGDNHTFNHLRGSDKLELELYNGDGEIALKFKMDYIHDNDLGPSGYATGGVSDPDGDGDMIIGDVDHILNVRTSLSENFNTYGYVLTSNSPETDSDYTPNPDYPNWIFEVWYEVTVSTDAFGDSGYDHPNISDFHASPSKTGNNSEPLEFVGCCEDNCNGSIDLTVISEEGPLTFLWSNGETTPYIDGLCEGEYSVVITNENGCEKEFEFTVLTQSACEIICPSDTILDCESSFDPSITGYAVVSENCSDSLLNYSDSTSVLCGTSQVVMRKWFINDNCENELSCIQSIQLIDTLPPVIIDPPSDISIECGEDIPEIPELMAEDNCSTDIIITVEEVISPSENTNCILETPIGDYSSFAIWLPDLDVGDASVFWVFDEDNGQLIINDDSTATITGHIVNTGDPNFAFDISMELVDKKDWETWHNGSNNGSYKDDFGYGADYYESWDYYILSNSSTLVGTGDLEGSTLNLSHAPANHYYAFQMGIGANNLNANYGGSGWFDYTGTFQGEEVVGNGDLGFDADCTACGSSILRTWTVTDECGNSSSFTQSISIENAIEPEVDEIFFKQPKTLEYVSFSTYPNPFKEKNFTEFSINEEGNISLVVLNANGKIVREIFNGKAEAKRKYQFTFEASDLPAGMYLYKLTTPNEIIIKKIMLAK